MFLITVKEWLGASKSMTIEESNRIVPLKSQVGFCTRLSLEKALIHLHQYQIIFNIKNLLAVNFSVIGVSVIDDLSDEIIDNSGMELIENKPITEKEYDDR